MTLKEQYPLSPRKFWKKMLSGVSGQGYGRARSSLFFTLLTLVITGIYTARLFSTLPGLPAEQIANSTPFWIANFTTIMVGGILSLIILWYIGKAFYISAYIRKYFYDADDSFVTIRKGVFSPTEIHVQYQKIQDVYVDQDILDRMMGLYDVHLASATITSGIEAHIDGVEQADAEGLKEFFLGKIKEDTATPLPNNIQADQVSSIDLSASPRFAENISSAAYPISSRWVVLQIVGSIFLAAFLLCIVLVTKVITASDIGNNPIMLELLYTLPFLIVLLVGWGFVYPFLWKATFSFDFASEYIVIRKGVFTRQENHTPYRSIQDVLISQGFTERLLGIATVTIQNAADGGLGWNSVVIPGQPLDKAQHLSEVVRQTLLSKNPSKMGL